MVIWWMNDEVSIVWIETMDMSINNIDSFVKPVDLILILSL